MSPVCADNHWVIPHIELNIPAQRGSSAFGNALERNQLDIRWLGKITPRWSYSLATRAFRNEQLGDSRLGRDDRYYARTEPSIRWEFIRGAFLNLGYRFRWQDRDDEGGSAQSNTVFVAIDYRWDRLSLSR